MLQEFIIDKTLVTTINPFYQPEFCSGQQ